MKPTDFYRSDDEPTARERSSMWNAIRGRASSRHAGPARIERRSFLYGAAAAVVLFFAGIGVYHVAAGMFDGARPVEYKIDRAYMNAIKEFESVVPAAVTPQERQSDRFLTSREQIQRIDDAIAALRRDMGSNDFSPVARERLKTLYSLKLRILQRMIDDGEVEL